MNADKFEAALTHLSNAVDEIKELFTKAEPVQQSLPLEPETLNDPDADDQVFIIRETITWTDFFRIASREGKHSGLLAANICRWLYEERRDEGEYYNRETTNHFVININSSAWRDAWSGAVSNDTFSYGFRALKESGLVNFPEAKNGFYRLTIYLPKQV